MLPGPLLPRRCLALALAAFVSAAVASAPVARAQESADAVKEARKMFQQGLELEQAGNWGGALRMFREVSQVRMTPQVRFHIAVCEENLGKLVAALGGYELALADADTVGESFRAEVEEKIARLRVRIPKLVIERGKGGEAANIELDGIVLGASSIGVDVPVDPGPHSVVARAPGFEDFSATVELAEEATETVLVTLKKVAAGSDPAVAAAVPADGGTDRPREAKLLPIGLIAGGGVALLGSGAALMLRSVALSDYHGVCPDDLCPRNPDSAQQETIDTSVKKVKTYNIVTPILAGVGLASVGVGVFLLIRDGEADKDATRSRELRTTRLEVVPVADGAPVGLSLRTRF